MRDQHHFEDYSISWISRIFVFVLFVLLNACSSETPPVLSIGTSIWPGYEPLYLAQGLNYFNDDQIRLVEYSAATDVLRAYRNKAVDSAALTLDEVLLLAQNGEEPRIVAVMDYSNGADAVLARPPINSVVGLRGRRIAVENTALGAYMLNRALEIHGLTSADVTIVPTTVDGHEKIYSSKHVDAVVTFDPVRTRLLLAGAVNVFDSSQIPGEIIDVLVVRREFAEAHREHLHSLLTSWYRALQYIEDSRADAMQRMARREQLSTEEFTSAFSGIKLLGLEDNRILLTGNQPGILIPATRLSHMMMERHLLQRKVMDLKSLTYPKPLLSLIPTQ